LASQLFDLGYFSRYKRSLMAKIPPCLLLVVIALSTVSCIRAVTPFDEVKWRHDVEDCDVSTLYAPHYKDGRYFNPWMPMESRGLTDLLRWRLSRGADYTEEEVRYRPEVIPRLKERILSLPDGDFIAWIGHATFLIRLNGEYWLTDPLFSERAFLPKRLTPPALSIEEMKELPGRLTIVVSHNHYDHLDGPSMSALPENARVFVPLGMKRSVTGMKKKDVQEMDWWQTIDCGNNIKIVCLPAQHWSRRITEGTDKTLWASFLIITPSATIYYGGDSGYFIGYKEIGRRYKRIDFHTQAPGNLSSEHGERAGEAPGALPPEGATRAPGAIDYALIPTTAYHPRWFMHYAHMNVREAIDAFRDLDAGYMIPTQWGTFQLGDEPIGYAGLEMKRVIREEGLDPERFLIMDIGQILPLMNQTNRTN
jgi:N-acyl-phosphatidylethanolamine-hydrolysing phospholipase D